MGAVIERAIRGSAKGELEAYPELCKSEIARWKRESERPGISQEHRAMALDLASDWKERLAICKDELKKRKAEKARKAVKVRKPRKAAANRYRSL
jgi:hypothetical protein